MRQNRWSARRTARRLGESTNGHRRLLADRGVLARLAVGVAAAVVTVAVIHAGGPPFTYRLGQTVSRDVRAKVKFDNVNETRTAKQRDQAADAVPPIYSNELSPVDEQHAAVKSLVTLVAGTESFDMLPASAAAEWGLTSDSFAALRAGLDAPERQEALVRAAGSFFEQLGIHGWLDASTQPPDHLRGSKIQVRNPQTNELVVCNVGDVDRESLLGEKGPLAQAIQQSLPPQAAEIFVRLMASRLDKLPANLAYDEPATLAAKDDARNSVPVETDTFSAGDLLVPQEKPITEEQLLLLRKEHERYVASLGAWAKLRRVASLTALVFGLYALAGYYVVRFERRLAVSLTRLALLAALVVGALGSAKWLHGGTLQLETPAIALAAMTVAIVYTQQFALLSSFGLGLLCAWMFGTGVNDFVVLTGGTAAAVLSLNRVRSRTKLIVVGAAAGMAYFVLTWATGLLAAQSAEMLLEDSFRRLLWGLLAGFLMSGILPFLERLFGIVTDINLLELSDVSHPLLLELMRKAPGTYNHSVTVATLAEGAAERIGANPLLCRVGSYFHDVGKMLKPQYFVENQSDAVNRHEALNPAMSTLIIIGHVKDGADLAHEHNLPQPIIDLIEQHHGTTLVEYFYQEATREAEENGDEEEDVQEASFRYPGPKPQTKDACVVMLADAVESASRTLSEPTPGRIEGLVHELALKRLLDGQFDECGITLQEIAAVKESLMKSLNAIYHGRVKYPEQQTV